MQFYKETDITDFFDVSIILPFYKKLMEFKKVLPKNLKYFQRNGIEVIIVLDAPEEEEELKNYLDEFPFLNSYVIVNRVPHEWRNPSKAMNVGIKKANRKYIFLACPETEFLSDVVYQLRYILQYYPPSFAIGQVCFLGMENTPKYEDILQYELLPYGSLMVEKKYLVEMGGYLESLTNWGGDDDNILTRLELLGLKKMFVSQAVAIHREENSDGHISRYKRNAAMPVDLYKEIFYPQQIIVNKNDWGTDFNQITYNSKSRNKRNQCINYLKKFKKYWLKDDNIFMQEFKIIALIQIKNEINHLPTVLIHLDKYCDGMILLDDNSTDGSYQAAMSEKLLLKVQKDSNTELFDDLALRNITLELAVFFNCEWLFFFDADERFDHRFADLYSITNRNDIDTVCFYVVHLWDTENFFRKDVPENKNGILPRFRMFRNYGNLKISSNRVLHFPATPFKQNRLNAPILIRHHGNIKVENRSMKYERYTKQDKDGLTQGYTFDYLLDDDVLLENVENIRCNVTTNSVDWIIL